MERLRLPVGIEDAISKMEEGIIDTSRREQISLIFNKMDLLVETYGVPYLWQTNYRRSLFDWKHDDLQERMTPDVPMVRKGKTGDIPVEVRVRDHFDCEGKFVKNGFTIEVTDVGTRSTRSILTVREDKKNDQEPYDIKHWRNRPATPEELAETIEFLTTLEGALKQGPAH